MGIVTLILGQPGTGKTTALRNMNPSDTLLVQCIKKPMPFRGKEWSYFDAEKNPKGNIFVEDGHRNIIEIIKRTKRNVIVLDDANYVMSNSFIRRGLENGYSKFTEIAQGTFEIFESSGLLPDNKRVYILAHTQQAEDGIIKYKTVGKLLDEKVSLDGMVTICLRTAVRDGEYLMSTKNNGNDTVKSPMGLFDSDFIPNDIKFVDDKICEYYEIS